jgi:hypothetical protein
MTNIDDSTQTPGYWFGVINGRLREQMRDALADQGLRRGGWRILNTLAEGPATPEELEERLPHRRRHPRGPWGPQRGHMHDHRRGTEPDVESTDASGDAAPDMENAGDRGPRERDGREGGPREWSRGYGRGGWNPGFGPGRGHGPGGWQGHGYGFGPDAHAHGEHGHENHGHPHEHPVAPGFERAFEHGYERGFDRGFAFGAVRGGAAFAGGMPFGAAFGGRGGPFPGRRRGPGFGHGGPRHGRVSRILADFTERGWVWFDGDRATLTDEGRAAHDAAAAKVAEVRARVAEGISESDWATTMSALETMARNLGWAPTGDGDTRA